ncbi:Uncharacterised protein [Providencia rettgeri]|uniref:Uncharacterized protein n=1 Tax=Providencia rettgeri TaxID=587 RepID=A0A379FTV7_PRORE|nr:Uncharacterised protein [Providencia rettgeri]
MLDLLGIGRLWKTLLEVKMAEEESAKHKSNPNQDCSISNLISIDYLNPSPNLYNELHKKPNNNGIPDGIPNL